MEATNYEGKGRMLNARVVRGIAVVLGAALLAFALAALLTPNASPDGPLSVGLSARAGHFLIFASLGFVAGAYRGAGVRRGVLGDVALLLAALLVLATLSEVAQLWVDGRSAERGDWVADAAGAAAGVFAGALTGLALVERPAEGR